MTCRSSLYVGVAVALVLSVASLGAQRRGGARGGEAHAQPRADQPRTTPPRTAPPRAARPQGERPRPVPRGTTGRAVPRGRVAPPRTLVYPEPRFYGYARPRIVVPVIRYPRPFFVFHPRFYLGFGIYTGIPVPYPVAFGYPAYVYGYPYGGVEAIAPPVNDQFGGLTFDISPPDTTVSVDGANVGLASDFSSTNQPLTLTPGRHHVELQAPGMVPLAFDVDIVAGEVIPYRGALRPA